jgi:enoyl-CoA hydratase
MQKLYETIIVRKEDCHILIVVLNRPDVSNAFNTEMAKELSNFFLKVYESEPKCRAIILTGSGEKAFSAGGDLKERLGMSLSAWQTQHQVFETMIRSIINCKIPTIGAINGAAFGGGCEIVAALDFSYAASSAKFAQTETKIGIIPGIGGTQTLTRAVGEKRAKEIILSAQTFSSDEALEWGLINAIFSKDELLAETIKRAKKITSNAPIAVQQAKKAIHNGLQGSLPIGMEIELECYNKTIKTLDREEGVLAFNENRTPRFIGR